MVQPALRKEEALGLGVAIAAHAGLVAFLLIRPASPPVPKPERITVTLSEDVGLTSTAPRPAADAAPDLAPTLGEPAPDPVPAPPLATPPAPPKATPAKPGPAPVPKPQQVTAPAKPVPANPVSAKAVPAKPATRPAPAAPAKSAANVPPAKPAKPATQMGGSRFSDVFAKGIPGAAGKTQSPNPPAAAVGPAVRSALAGAISRQLKPRWVAPQGIEAEKLITILAWDLNPDGSLAGSPRVVRQEGITAANRAQAQRHAEQAVRAVRLAAPFNLPDEYYSAWKRITEFRFDRRLSQ